MSIKAKLEAIIYAAEDPITLDQMASLLKDDLLALKYRFSGLELVAPWPPVIGKTAELLPRGGRSPGRPYVKTADSSAAPHDERPILVVADRCERLVRITPRVGVACDEHLPCDEPPDRAGQDRVLVERLPREARPKDPGTFVRQAGPTL